MLRLRPPLLTLRTAPCVRFSTAVSNSISLPTSGDADNPAKPFRNDRHDKNDRPRRPKNTLNSEPSVDQRLRNSERKLLIRRHPPPDVPLDKPSAVKLPHAPHQPPTTDPLKFLDSVQRVLKTGEVARAVIHLRKAGTKIDTLPAWNAVIQYRFEEQRYAPAHKAYNELKKRGLKPDSRTYHIMLSGISKMKMWRETLVKDARRIYDSIEKPTTAHTNSLLTIYKRAGMTSEMWEILNTLNARASDKATYTVLLESLAISEEPDAVDDAIRAWSGILSRWKNGALEVDAKLVSAMLFVLLGSKKTEHWTKALEIAYCIYGINFLGYTDTESLQKYQIPTLTPLPEYNELVIIPLLKAADNLRSLQSAKQVWEHYKGREQLSLETHHTLLYNFQKARKPGEALKIVQTMPHKPTSLTYTILLRTCAVPKRDLAYWSNLNDIYSAAEKDLGEDKMVDDLILQAYLDVPVMWVDQGRIVEALRKIRPLVLKLPVAKMSPHRQRLATTVQKALEIKGIAWLEYELDQWWRILGFLLKQDSMSAPIVRVMLDKAKKDVDKRKAKEEWQRKRAELAINDTRGERGEDVVVAEELLDDEAQEVDRKKRKKGWGAGHYKDVVIDTGGY